MVLILDFGSQYTQLIARRVREAGVYCEVRPYDLPRVELKRLAPAALILSGSPQSANAPDAYHFDPKLLAPDLPVLGICYGMQVTMYALGGTLRQARHAEFGAVTYMIDRSDALTKGLPRKFRAWMSHGDEVAALPPGYVATGHTANCGIAGARHVERPWHFVQFHPEVLHTSVGREILSNFLLRVAKLTPDWRIEHFLEEQVAAVRRQVGKGRVLCGLSGGVDSSVVAALLHRAIGDRLTCLFVDHGLMRKGEGDEVTGVLAGQLGLPVVRVDARKRFLKALAGVEDPERKRKIIGREFIRVFEIEAKKLGKVDFLAQGTLYPDVIESASVGKAHVIKSHHNVGGLPERMKLELVEPVRTLFKDEVRALGRVLGLPASMIGRHPFPGPGLAVRILGPVNAEDLEILRNADAVFIDELRRSRLYDKVWQAFAVLLPVRTVGVMGDARTYDRVLGLRAVNSQDGMTADWSRLPHAFLARASSRIVNEVRGVSRVVYDVSSKPPATIEWE
ncbi:MAG: glutamine-hydrolyzing GMP synthase [Candidatus Eisenbacteria bacterium]